jgi:hypothetical protein
MRFLRIPIVESDAQQMPEWIIGDLERRDEERREAPRLELPVPEFPERLPEPKPAEAPSTVIVIDL